MLYGPESEGGGKMMNSIDNSLTPLAAWPKGALVGAKTRQIKYLPDFLVQLSNNFS